MKINILLPALLWAVAGYAQNPVPEGPAGNAFWDSIPARALDGAERGDIYWVRERADAPANARGWNVIYVSEGADGGLQYVSGEIYVPRTPAPDSGRPMIIWGVGTPGFQDSCAPSRTGLYPVNGQQARVPAIEDLLARGYVIVMSDYQGLGTPGPFAYLQGEAQAKASLDIARAAVAFPSAQAALEIGVYGFSQGGQTALWVAHIVNDYAPDFELVGAVPVAPASRHLDLSFYDLGIPENSAYFITRMAGLQVGHPELALRDILTEAGLELLTAQSWGCYEIFSAAATLSEPYARPEALEEGSAWRAWLEANDEFLPIPDSVPILMIQGDEDVDVPVGLTREVTEDLCRLGNQVEYVELPGAGHFGALVAIPDYVPDWFDARFSGTAARNTCVAE